MNTVEIAKKLFDSEIEELIKVRDKINESIENVVELILNSKGKVVITGIGKSGLIGKKISRNSCLNRNTRNIYELC